MRHLLPAGLALLIALLLFGCGQAPAPSSGIPRGQTTIGPKGGFLTTQNEEATIYIPEGTLQDERLITIRVVDEITVPTEYGIRVSPVVEITPRNLTLNGRVQITLSVHTDGITTASEGDEPSFSIIYGDDGHWRPASEVTRLTQSNQVQGHIDGLGIAWAAQPGAVRRNLLPLAFPVRPEECPRYNLSQGYGAVEASLNRSSPNGPGHRHHQAFDIGHTNYCGPGLPGHAYGYEAFVYAVGDATLHRIMKTHKDDRVLGNVIQLRLELLNHSPSVIYATYAHLADEAHFQRLWSAAASSGCHFQNQTQSYECPPSIGGLTFRRGEIIGAIGASGSGSQNAYSGKPHLHFSLSEFDGLLHSVPGPRLPLPYTYAHPDHYGYLDPSLLLYPITESGLMERRSIIEGANLRYIPTLAEPSRPAALLSGGTEVWIRAKAQTEVVSDCPSGLWFYVGATNDYTRNSTDIDKTASLYDKTFVENGTPQYGESLLEFSFAMSRTENLADVPYIRYGWVCSDLVSGPDSNQDYAEIVLFHGVVNSMRDAIFSVVVAGVGDDFHCSIDFGDQLSIDEDERTKHEFRCLNGEAHTITHTYRAEAGSEVQAMLTVRSGDFETSHTQILYLPEIGACPAAGSSCTDPDPVDPDPELTINSFSATVSNGFDARFTGSNTGTDSSDIRCRISYGDGQRSSWFSCGGSSWTHDYTYREAQTATAILDVEMGTLTDTRQVMVDVPGIDEPDPVPDPELELTINSFSATVSNGFDARFTGSNTGTDSSDIRCRISYGDGQRSSWFSCGGSSWTHDYTYREAQTATAILDVEMGTITDTRQVTVDIPGIDEPNPVSPEITRFTVSPTSLEGAGDVDVNWRVQDAEWCTLVVSRGPMTYSEIEYNSCANRGSDTVYLDGPGTYTFFFGAANNEGHDLYQPAPTVTVATVELPAPRITGFDPAEITALSARQFIVIFGTNLYPDSVITAIAPTGIRYEIPEVRTVNYDNTQMAINAQLDEVGTWYIEVHNSAGTHQRALVAR